MKKIIIGVVVGVLSVGGCSSGSEDKKSVVSTTTTVNQIQTRVTNPPTTVTQAPKFTSTTAKPVPTTQKPVAATTTTQAPSQKKCLVSGYTRKDGTTVNSYYRSC